MCFTKMWKEAAAILNKQPTEPSFEHNSRDSELMDSNQQDEAY